MGEGVRIGCILLVGPSILHLLRAVRVVICSLRSHIVLVNRVTQSVQVVRQLRGVINVAKHMVHKSLEAGDLSCVIHIYKCADQAF